MGKVVPVPISGTIFCLTGTSSKMFSEQDRDQIFFLAENGTGAKFFFSPRPGPKMTGPVHV